MSNHNSNCSSVSDSEFPACQCEAAGIRCSCIYTLYSHCSRVSNTSSLNTEYSDSSQDTQDLPVIIPSPTEDKKSAVLKINNTIIDININRLLEKIQCKCGIITLKSYLSVSHKCDHSTGVVFIKSSSENTSP